MNRKRPGGPRSRARPRDGDAASEAAKSRAIDILSECFAQDLLDIEDFERRADLVHRAEAAADLEEAVRGLPLPGGPAPVHAAAPPAPGDHQPVPAVHSTPGTQPVPLPTGSVDAPAPVATGAPAPTPAGATPPGRIRDHDRSVAVFGETKRQGKWVPARRTTLVTFMGSAVVDLREALLAPGEYAVQAVAAFGSVEVIVPPGMDVECNGSAVFGTFEQRDPTPAVPRSGGPVVRVDGFAVFGSVEVIVRYPGESKGEARRRKRLEKKQRRRLKAGK